MASISSVGGLAPGSAPLSPATATKIRNVSLPLANTEVPQVLTANLKKFIIKSRDITTLKVATIATGTTVGPWVTLKGTQSTVIDGLDFSGTIYLNSNRAGVVIEIWEWF